MSNKILMPDKLNRQLTAATLETMECEAECSGLRDAWDVANKKHEKAYERYQEVLNQVGEFARENR